MKGVGKFSGHGTNYLWVLILTLAATLAIYLQTISFDYVGYDDRIITRSGQQVERGISAASLKQILVPRSMSTYQPLRDLAVEAVYEFSGTSPAGYHWFNLIMFLLNLAAVFWLLSRLLALFNPDWPGGARLWAALGTAWFAVHPVHVEAVAWMNSNKELLAGLFYFLALGLYLDSRSGSILSVKYLASWLCFLLGLMAKPSGAAFPLVLAVLEMTVSGSKVSRSTAVIRLTPYLLLSALAGGYFVFRSSTGTGVWLQDSAAVHLLSMASVLGRYVIDMLLPVNLCHSYPPPFFFGDYDWRLALYLILDFLLLFGAWTTYRRGERAIAFGMTFFLLNLLPVSGLVPIAVFRADRYLYIPSLGLILAGLATLRYLVVNADSGRARALVTTGSALGLLLMGAIARERCGDWRNSITLWRSAVRTHGNFQFNYYGLGMAYYGRGMLAEALESFRNANRFQDNFQCHYLSGRIFEKTGQPDSARVHLEIAAELFTPEMRGQMEEMADIHRRLGSMDKLAAHLALWARQRPEETKFVLDMAAELAKIGDNKRAAELLAQAALSGAEPSAVALLGADIAFAAGDWERAVQGYSSAGTDVLDGDRQERLAAACLHSGRKSRALVLFRALAEKAKDGPGPAQLNNIGAVLEAMDSLEAAEGYFRAAVALDSAYADGWYNLGRVLSERGRLREALESYRRSSDLTPGNLESGLALARLQAGMGLGADAVKTYAALINQAPNNPALLLEAADFAWESGRRKIAGEFYTRLAAAIPGGELPPRVFSRRK